MREVVRTLVGGFARRRRARRIDAARELLRTSSLTMKEIAATVGFGDSSQFSRQFTRMMGVTPTHFRRAVSSIVPPAASPRNKK